MASPLPGSLYCTRSGGIGHTKSLDQGAKFHSRKFPWSLRVRRDTKLNPLSAISATQSIVSFGPSSPPLPTVSLPSSPHLSPSDSPGEGSSTLPVLHLAKHSNCSLEPSRQPGRINKSSHLRHSQSWSTLSSWPRQPQQNHSSSLHSSTHYRKFSDTASSTRRSNSSTPSLVSNCSSEITRPSGDSWITSASSLLTESSTGASRKQLRSGASMLSLLHIRRGGNKQVTPRVIDFHNGSHEITTDGAQSFKSYPSLPDPARIQQRFNHRTAKATPRQVEGCLPARSIFPSEKSFQVTWSNVEVGGLQMPATHEPGVNSLAGPLAPRSQFQNISSIRTTPSNNKPPAPKLLPSNFPTSSSLGLGDSSELNLSVEDPQFAPFNPTPTSQCKRWAVINVASSTRDPFGDGDLPSPITSGPLSNSDGGSNGSTFSGSPSADSRFSPRPSTSSRDTSPSSMKYEQEAEPTLTIADEVDDELENAQVMTGSRVVCFNSSLKHVRYRAIQRTPSPSSRLPLRASHLPSPSYQDIPLAKIAATELSQLVELYHDRNVTEHPACTGAIVHEIGCAI